MHERPVVMQVFELGEEVTVYEVTALPPLLAGALQLISAERLKPTPLTAVGAPGTVGVNQVTVRGVERATIESPPAVSIAAR